MKKCTAFVLGGGGSRGALQVGAVRALLEAGIVPDLLVGTSIGAVNATGLALWGADPAGVDSLERAWKEVSGAQLLDPRIGELMMKAMIGRPSEHTRKKFENFFLSKGIRRDLRFRQIIRIRLGLISADIETGQPVIYGQDPEDCVLEGLMASISLPPWFTPFHKDSQLMVDGGVLSNLPIESALRMGATEIFALDLDDSRQIPLKNLTFAQFLEKFVFAISQRYVSLETALAVSQGVPVHTIEFRGLARDPIWDFANCQPLIGAGYEKAGLKIAEWRREPPPE